MAAGRQVSGRDLADRLSVEAVAAGRQRSPPTGVADQADVIGWTHEKGASMSGAEYNPTGTLDERLRLGAGFAEADRPAYPRGAVRTHAAYPRGAVRTHAAPVWVET
jgi:hypothetical protein